MINFVKILNSSITKGRRILKFLRLGKKDVQTSFESMPFGIDSAPLKNMKAVYMNTGEKGKSVIVGYINESQISKAGELRLYSDFDGYVYLTENGDLELNGKTDNAVAHAKLQTDMATFKTEIEAQLLLIATGITGAGGTYSYVAGTIKADISNSKVDKVKL